MNKLIEAIHSLGTILDTPRRLAWGGRSGEDVTGDPYSGLLLEALGDPLNLIGLGAAGLIGRKAMKVNSAAKAIRRSPLLVTIPAATEGIEGTLRGADIPEVLYHVTGRADDISRSGRLLAVAPQGGLGYFRSARPNAVSFTTSMEDARNIQRELLRHIDAAKGNIGEGTFKQWAIEDAVARGLEESAYDSAARRAKVRFARTKASQAESDLFYGTRDPENYGQYLANGGPVLPNLVGDFGVDAHNAYMAGRQFAGGDIDPVFLGGYRQWQSLSPSNVKIIAVPRSAIPEESLTRFHGPGLNEVQVHGDVPIDDAMFLGGAPRRSRAIPALLTAMLGYNTARSAR